jgi:uncharacterized LabA/DUF88 family protein
MILVDTTSLFFSCKRRYSTVIDYRALFHHIESTHGRQKKIVYVSEHKESAGFIKVFEQVSECDLLLKKPTLRGTVSECDFNVELSIDALTQEYDELIICSSDYKLLPLIQYLHGENVKVSIYSVGIPAYFGPYCNMRELPERLVRRAA